MNCTLVESGMLASNERVKELQDEVKSWKAKYKRARNELCERCGNYRQSHTGACNGCCFKE